METIRDGNPSNSEVMAGMKKKQAKPTQSNANKYVGLHMSTAYCTDVFLPRVNDTLKESSFRS